MHVYANKGPQERLALRRSERIAKSELFSSYVEEARKVIEEGTKTDKKPSQLSDIIQDRFFDDIFDNSGIFGSLSYNRALWGLIKNDIFKSDDNGFDLFG